MDSPIKCLAICRKGHVRQVIVQNIDDFSDLNDNPLKCSKAGCLENTRVYLKPRLSGRQFSSVDELMKAQCSPTVQNRFRGLALQKP